MRTCPKTGQYIGPIKNTKKPRVFFVGIHNKPGLPPLCSSTKSGKVIDRVIAQLPGLECVKTNLFDREYIPRSLFLAYKEAADYWARRVNWTPDDIVIALGNNVISAFKRAKDNKIRNSWHGFPHPSRISKENLEAMIYVIKHPNE